MDRRRRRRHRGHGSRAIRNRLVASHAHSAVRLDIEPLEDRRMLAPVPYLLKDINPATHGSNPEDFVVFEGLGYFEAKGQLWRTDGTSVGTERVGDYERIGGLTVWQDALWFLNAGEGLELWKSDGAAEGAVRMAALPTVQYTTGEITGTSRGLFFAASQQSSGNELWASNGTAEGTRLLKDIRPGKNSSNPQKLVEIGDWVYFTANDGVNGSELWRTDGTEAQTAMLRDLTPGQYGAVPSKPVDLNGEAYFTASSRLWKSDGTSAGTVELLRSGATESSMISLNGRVLFSGMDPVTNDVGLWTTDGDFTYLVKDPNPSGSTMLDSFVVMDGALYFTANSGELWRSDGTPQGTYSLGRIEGAEQNWTNLAAMLYGDNGQLLLTASNSKIGTELWRWDGAGPALVEDITPGSDSSGIKVLGNYNGLLVFSANDGTWGDELWVSDGTESGTLMLKDIETRSNSQSADPEKFVEVNGVTYFVARQTAHGSELWKTDGTTAGTMMVKDISPGFDDTEFASLHNLNGKLVFFRKYYDAPDEHQDEEGTEVWVSDGTASGTQRVARLPFSDSSGVGEALTIGNTLFFTFEDDYDEVAEPPGNELWRTDGTAYGTFLLKNIRVGELDSDPANFVELNGQLYFTADDGSGPDLWRSDGTQSGTVLVKRLEPEFSYSTIYNMARADGRLFFAMRDDQWRRSLWTSDGTTAGTLKLYEVESNDGEFKYPFATLGGRLIFNGPEPGNSDYSLMVSDGTLAGTVRLGRANYDPFVEVNGTLFYELYEEPSDQAVLWKTDGTPQGTGPAFAPALSEVNPLWNANGTLLFSDHNSQIWATDGTAESLQLVDTEFWYDLYTAGEFSYFMKNYNWYRDKFMDPGPMVLRNATALVDLNGPGAGKSFATSWAGAPVPIADPSATILSSQENLTELRLRLARATPGLLLFSDTSGTTIVATFDGEVLRLSGEDSRDNYERVLKSVRFHASGDAARLASVELEVQAFTAEGFAVVPVRTTIELSSAVVGRRLFYNNSSFDGEDAGANTGDDGSIATDKVAYMPGSGLTTTASVSSYSRGINGLMIDFAGLAGSLTADDFTFRVGSNSPESWTLAPAPLEVVVRAGAGAGGSERVTITWADGAIKNTWLQVIVEGNDAAGGFNTNTGLAASDVFFFGNRVGDTFVNAAPTATGTSAADELGARFHPGINQPVTSVFDFNRDGVVSAADQLIARNNAGLLLMIDLDEPLLSDSFEHDLPLGAAGYGELGFSRVMGSPRWWLAFALAAAELEEELAAGVSF